MRTATGSSYPTNTGYPVWWTRFRGLAAQEARGLHVPCPLLANGGSRECRVHAAPVVSCAIVRIENAHEHTGTVGTLRHSLRNGFTAYGALSPETNSSCLRRWRISGWSNPVGSTSPPLNLAPATGVGTTRFCRTLQRRSSCAPRSLTVRTALRSLPLA